MRTAYHQVLYAFGNNHAGTYYPVALVAVPFLLEIAAHGGPWARVGALDILVDLTGSFEPEAGCEVVTDRHGVARPTHMQMLTVVSRCRAVLVRIASSAASSHERALARDVIDTIDD